MQNEFIQEGMQLIQASPLYFYDKGLQIINASAPLKMAKNIQGKEQEVDPRGEVVNVGVTPHTV